MLLKTNPLNNNKHTREREREGKTLREKYVISKWNAFLSYDSISSSACEIVKILSANISPHSTFLHHLFQPQSKLCGRNQESFSFFLCMFYFTFHIVIQHFLFFLLNFQLCIYLSIYVNETNVQAHTIQQTHIHTR